MKQLYLTLFLTIIGIVYISAQHKYDYIWPMGYDHNPFDDNNELVGRIENLAMDFNDPSSIYRIDSFYIQLGGTHGSLCDRNGIDVKYVSNGCEIRNGNGQILINGDSINSSGFIWEDLCNEGFSNRYPWDNCAVMLPNPNQEGHTAMFHLFLFEESRSDPFYTRELRLTEMVGDTVVRKNTTVIADTLFAGWLASVKTADTMGWWVLTHEIFENKIHAVRYLPCLDSLEINTQRIGLEPKDRDEVTGDALFSHDGRQYYTMDKTNHLQIYDFDRSTGLLNNHRNIRFDIDTFYRTGMAISGSGQFMYINDFNYIYQVDLWSNDIASSIQVVAEYDGLVHPRLGFQNFINQQLGPYCRIYITANGSHNRLHIINEPNKPGLDCEVIQHAIIFPEVNHPRSPFVVLNNRTMPNFPNFRLDTGEPVCNPDLKAPLTNSEEVVLETSMRILLWPNPVSDKLQIDIGIIQNFSGQFVLHNSLGQIQKQIDIYSGQRRYQLPVHDLQPGMYFYEIRSAGQLVKSGRVVVQY